MRFGTVVEKICVFSCLAKLFIPNFVKQFFVHIYTSGLGRNNPKYLLHLQHKNSLKHTLFNIKMASLGAFWSRKHIKRRGSIAWSHVDF